MNALNARADAAILACRHCISVKSGRASRLNSPLSRFFCLFRRNDSVRRGKPMRYTDIAIVGGGLAGSTTAAMLGRAGIPAIMVDPHQVYRPDFRVEKLGGAQQLLRFRKTGLADSVLLSATHGGENWIARFG